jgi:uncharacterized protein
VIYLDTSALVKLVVEEEESSALEHWLVLQDEPFTTSVFGRVELLRACQRLDPATLPTAHMLLAEVPLMTLTGWVLDIAENIGPPTLRTLDAVHLASAHDLGRALSGFVTYDKSLRDAAALLDYPVMSPGMA